MFSASTAEEQIYFILGGYLLERFTLKLTLVAFNGIAQWNGTNWTAAGSGMNSVIYALALSGSTSRSVTAHLASPTECLVSTFRDRPGHGLKTFQCVRV